MNETWSFYLLSLWEKVAHTVWEETAVSSASQLLHNYLIFSNAPSSPCTPGPSRYFVMLLLKGKVPVHTVSLHLAPGISL